VHCLFDGVYYVFRVLVWGSASSPTFRGGSPHGGAAPLPQCAPRQRGCKFRWTIPLLHSWTTGHGRSGLSPRPHLGHGRRLPVRVAQVIERPPLCIDGGPILGQVDRFLVTKPDKECQDIIRETGVTRTGPRALLKRTRRAYAGSSLAAQACFPPCSHPIGATGGRVTLVGTPGASATSNL
jgi:hypothetical protein